MHIISMFNCLLTFVGAVLAFPHVHADVESRSEDICGSYRNKETIGTIWLNAECQNFDFEPVYITSVTNEKCAICIMFRSAHMKTQK